MFKKILLLITFASALMADPPWLRTYTERVPDWNGYDSLLITEANVFKVKGGDTAVISGTDSLCSESINLVINQRRPVSCAFWWNVDRVFDGSDSTLFHFNVEVRQLRINGTFTRWVVPELQGGSKAFPIDSVLVSKQYTGNDPVTTYDRLEVEANQLRICPESNDGADSLVVVFDGMFCY